MRVGLLGGTFNPPHRGHLKLAELALEALGLDEVRFIPTAAPPHKPLPSGDPDGPTRVRLLEEALAAGGRPFKVEPLEVERGGTSFTVDTLELLALREPRCGWIFLMGSDQLPGFPSWKRVERILELASVAVAPRPASLAAGSPGERPAMPGILAHRVRPRWSGGPGEAIWLPGTGLDLASTALRAELGMGRSPDGIPAEVMAAILREKQYR
jgi:nicotinate-nucleotide adenylyltransferase